MRDKVYDITKTFLREKYNISETTVDEVRRSLNIPIEVEVIWLGEEEEDAHNKKERGEIRKLLEKLMPYIKIGGVITTVVLLTAFNDYLSVKEAAAVLVLAKYIEAELKELRNPEKTETKKRIHK